MGNVCGTVVQQSPSTFSWLFEYEKLPNVCSSQKFYISGHKYEVSFRLENYFLNKSHLFLHVFKTFALKLDLDIIIRYKDGRTTDYSLEDIACYSIGPFRLANVERNGLIEVRCTFSNIRESTRSGWIKSENTDKDEQEAGSSQITHEGGNINSEVNEAKKSIGLVGLSENFKDVLMSEEDSDVIFKVGEQNYPAHKVIIKARSSVFKAMLNHEMREKNEGVIDIPDCDPGIFRDFLFYIYTGKNDDISKENVFELYRMSDKYDVKDLKTECVDLLLKNLSVDIICDVMSLATRHCEQALLSRAIEFFTDHAQDILTSVNWQNFVKDYPVEANELFLKTFNKVSGK